MQYPVSQRSPAPTSHWLLWVHTLHPLVDSPQVSTAPLAPHRRAPWVHVVAQAAQLPLEQKVFAGHCWAPPHDGQLLVSVPQVSTPLPLQRVSPEVHEVPHTPHAPPEQKVVHASVCAHEVQPLALATQVSTFRPVQRREPAVQVVLHALQLPFEHTLPDGQVRAAHWVQPESTLH